MPKFKKPIIDENGKIIIEVTEHEYKPETLDKINIEQKKLQIGQIKLLLGKSDNKINRYHRQVDLVSKGLLVSTKLSEDEFNALELQRETWCNEIELLEAELIELGVDV